MRVTDILAVASLLLPCWAGAAEFRTVTPEQVTTWLRGGHRVAVVDFQPRVEFADRHFEGAISAVGPGELERLARRLSRSRGDVVVVTEKGGAEAVDAAERLAARGLARGRIALLMGGMAAALAQAGGCSCCKAPAPEEVSE